MAKILDGIKNAWNAFIRGDPPEATIAYGYGYSYRPDRNSLSGEKAKSIVAAIYTRISIDAAAITMEHARLDENQRFKESIDSPFNDCLKLEANLDQGARAFRQDMCMSMLDDGVSEEFLVKLGLEYKYLTWYLTGKIGYEQMVEELGSAIKRFAKRQMTWFRRDPRIIWLDMKEDPVSRASELITDFLGKEA